MPDPQESLQIAVGVVVADGRVLLTRRQKGVHLEGFWEFPGGKLQPGETPEQCVCREVAEETGLEVTPLRVLAAYPYHYPDRSVHLSFLECCVTGGTLDPSHHEARWANLSELASLEMPPANAPVLVVLSKLHPVQNLPHPD